MNDIYEYFNKNGIKINKIKNKNNYSIIDDKYLIKEKSKINFSSLPLIDSYNDYEIYRYYEDNCIDKNKRILLLLEDIHKRDISYDINYDDLYNSINNKIDVLMNYYLKLQDDLESLIYTRNDYILLLENISLFYKILSISKEKNDYWYSIKDKRIRKCLCLNNIDLDNFIINDKDYIIDSSLCSNDLIIMDYIKLYRNNLSIDNIDLNEREFYLLLTYICIPYMISFSNNISDNIKIIKEEVNYINKTINYVLEKDKEYQETNKKEFNE